MIKYKKIAYEEAEKIGAEVIEIKAKEKTEEISDYFRMVSGNDEDKIAKAGVHVTKSEFVDAPIIEEYLNENGKIDVDKMEIITFDMVSNTYRVLGDIVENAFKDGLNLNDKKVKKILLRSSLFFYRRKIYIRFKINI